MDKKNKIYLYCNPQEPFYEIKCPHCKKSIEVPFDKWTSDLIEIAEVRDDIESIFRVMKGHPEAEMPVELAIKFIELRKKYENELSEEE